MEEPRPGSRLLTLARARALGLAASLLAAAGSAAQVPPETAVLAGQAVDAVTGAPVANTLIGLSQRARSGPNTTPVAPNTRLVVVMADAQGRFVIRDVPKGSFLLLATAPGYIVSNFGQARATGPTQTIDLSGNERLVDLKIPLWRHGVISGVVTDEAGEPVVGVTVRVLRRMGNGPGGQARYLPGTQTSTDDRGAYRLTALTPGRFLVAVPQTQVTVPASVVDAFLQSAAGRTAGRADGQLLDLMSSTSVVPSAAGGVRIDDLLVQSSGQGRLLTPPPPTPDGFFVYPAATYAAEGSGPATEVAIGPGEERAGIDLRVRPERAVRVTGTVTADGEPVPHVSVRLVGVGVQPLQVENGFESAATVTGANGSFTLLGVTPGQYLLKVLRTPRLALPPSLASNPSIAAAYSPTGPAPSPGASRIVGAQVRLAIGDADVRDLAIALRPGATITGRLVFRGSTPSTERLQTFGVLLTSEDGGIPGAPLAPVRVTAEGTFTIAAPAPGRYMVTALGPPAAGWHRAGVLVAGQPLTGPIDLSGNDAGDVSLIFTDEAATIAGTVRRTDGTVAPSAGLVVFATDRRAWAQDPLNPRQPRVEQTARGGGFTLTGLLPGEYFIAAVEDKDAPDEPGPEFLQAVSRFATRVTVTAREVRTVSLTMGSLR